MRFSKIFTGVLAAFLLTIPVFAQKQAEVAVTFTYLRKEPDYNAEKLQTLQKGEKVMFEKGRGAGSWSYVSVGDGAVKGWILTATLQTLKNVEKVAPKTEPTTQTPVKMPTQNPRTNDKKADPQLKTEVPVENPIQPTTIQPTISTQTVVVNPTPKPTPDPNAIEQENETVKVNTEEVSLNVRVLNAGNRPVGNLRETSFQVYEDGVLQPITSVSTAEVPIFNALVIDNSRSLRTQLSKVVEAGKIIVGMNKEQDESAVVRFISSDKIEVVQNFTSDQKMLDNALDNLSVEGGQTAIIDAVYKTAEMVGKYQNSKKKEDVKIRTLIVVSDGEDRSSQASEKMLFDLLRNSYVQIYAVGFTENLSDEPDPETGISRRAKARAFLTRLAEETGGKVYFPDSIEQLPKIAMEISGELRTQYLVSYSPTNDTRDGGFRRIKVEIVDSTTGEKRTAITRTGRNAAVNK